MAKKLTKAEKIAKMPIEDIIKISGPYGRARLIEYARTLRAGYRRRAQSIKNHELISHAQISLEASLPKRNVQLTKLTRNQLILEIARYQKFFNDETSSLAGIRRVNNAQDIRLFGADSRGRPRARLSPEERERFWSLYDEYKNQNPAGTNKYGSETVQQILASRMIDEDGKTVTEMLDSLEAELSENLTTENMEIMPNVYSGRGPFEPA